MKERTTTTTTKETSEVWSFNQSEKIVIGFSLQRYLKSIRRSAIKVRKS